MFGGNSVDVQSQRYIHQSLEENNNNDSANIVSNYFNVPKPMYQNLNSSVSGPSTSNNRFMGNKTQMS